MKTASRHKLTKLFEREKQPVLFVLLFVFFIFSLVSTIFLTQNQDVRERAAVDDPYAINQCTVYPTSCASGQTCVLQTGGTRCVVNQTQPTATIQLNRQLFRLNDKQQLFAKPERTLV